MNNDQPSSSTPPNGRRWYAAQGAQDAPRPVPRFGLASSRARIVFVLTALVFALPVAVLFGWNTWPPFGSVALAAAVLVCCAAVFYLEGVRYPVSVVVENDAVVCSWLFSKRILPIQDIYIVKLHGEHGPTLGAYGAPKIPLHVSRKDWNRFAGAFNHFYPKPRLRIYEDITTWNNASGMRNPLRFFPR